MNVAPPEPFTFIVTLLLELKVKLAFTCVVLALVVVVVTGPLRFKVPDDAEPPTLNDRLPVDVTEMVPPPVVARVALAARLNGEPTETVGALIVTGVAAEPPAPLLTV